MFNTLKSIGQKIATTVYNTVNKVGSSIGSALSSVGKQPAAAAMAFPVTTPAGLQTVKNAGLNAVQKYVPGQPITPLQGGDLSKVNVSAKPAPTIITPTAPLRSGTSGASTSYTPQSFVSPGVADVPTSPSTINTGFIADGGYGANTLTGSGGGATGSAISTGLATPTFGTDSGSMPTLYDPITGQRIANPAADQTNLGNVEDLFAKYFPKKESVLQNPSVVEAQDQYDQARARVNAINSKITAIQNRANAAALSTQGQGRGIPLDIIGGQQAEIYKEAAIQSLPLLSQLAYAQGDMQTAQEHLTRVTALLTEEANNNFEFQKSMASAVIGFATDIQKARIQSALDQNKAFATQQATIYGMLAQNNAPPTVWEAVRAAKNIDQLYAAAGKYGTDILGQKLKLAQIDAENALANQRNNANNGGGTAPGYNGEFAATIDIAANAFGTNQQRAQVRQNLQNFIAQGDYKSAYAVIAQATAKGLTGTAATNFQQQQNSLGVLADLKHAIQDYANAGGNTNIFKGTADNIQTKIGQLETDPKYAALAVQLTAAFQQYRLQMTGAAFGVKESAEYASILPDKSNSLDLNLAKLEGAQNYLNSSVTSSIRSIVGDGGVYIKEYADGAQSQTPQTATDPQQAEYLQWLNDNGL